MNHFESQDNEQEIVIDDDVVQFEDLDAPDTRRIKKWQQYLQRLFTRKLRRYWFMGGIVVSLICLSLVLIPSSPFLHKNSALNRVTDAYTYDVNKPLVSISFVQAITPQYIYTEYRVLRGKNEIRALRRSNGTKVWSYRIDVAVVNQLAIANNILYTNMYNGHVNSLYALNALTGVLLWKYDLPTSSTSVSLFSISITIANGIIYDISTQGNVVALQSQTGRLLWLYRQSDQTGVKDPSVINDMEFKLVDNVMYLAFLREERFVAIDALTGNLLWQANKYYAFFAARADISYVSDQQSSLYAFQSHTGKLIWESPIPLLQGQYVLASPDLLIYAQTDGSIEALHIKTLAVAWRSKSFGMPTTLLQVINNRLYLIVSDISQNWSLISQNPSNGRLLWRFNGKILFTRIKGTKDYIYAKSVTNQIYALQVRTGKLLWKSLLGASLSDDGGYVSEADVDPTFQIMNNHVFITTVGQNNNVLTIIDNETGYTLWERATVIGMPSLFANDVYITGADGALYAYEENSGKQLWSVQ